MAQGQGLSLPVQIVRGRTIMETGESQLRKLILLALSDCSSANPFVDIGFGSDVVFELNDEFSQAEIRQRIARVFARFSAEGRARLASGSPKFRVSEGELIVDISYVNVQTTETDEVAIAFGSMPRVVG